MESRNENFQDVVKLLRKNKFFVHCDAHHEQELRRALLNSSYFTSSPFLSWLRRLGLENVSLSLAGFSLLFGIFLAFGVQFAFLGMSASSSLSEIPADSSTKSVFQELYNRGKIRYVGSGADGSRIYVFDSPEHSQIEIHDRSPMRFEVLAASNK